MKDRFGPYLKDFKVDPEHPLIQICSKFEARGLSPLKLQKAHQHLILQLQEGMTEETRKRQREYQINREIALRKAKLEMSATKENKKKEDQLTDEEKIEMYSFDKLMEYKGIWTMDGERLTDDDYKQLTENIEKRQADFLIRGILIANGEIDEAPLEKN